MNFDHQSFEKISAECLPLIEAKIASFLARVENGDGRWHARHNATMTRYHLETGGKRLRALIPCWVFAAYGRDPRAAIPLGVALELIHNGTLVHDDLQDGDTMRRGRPTVWKQYSSAQAINCGDALFFFGWEALQELEVPPAAWRRIAGCLSRGVLAVIEGQAQEMLMKDEPAPGWDRYVGVVTAKTAYLIASAVTASLLALEENEAVCHWAENAALAAGVLFQIQDDLLDVYGEKQRERRASDIAEGKISALVALFNEVAPAEEREFLGNILRAPRETVTCDQISRVLQMFENRGVLPIAIEKLRKLRAVPAAPPEYPRQMEMGMFFQEMNEKFLKPISSLCE